MRDRPRGANAIDWNQVALFVGVTFGLTLLVDLAIFLTRGYSQAPGTLMLVQGQMLLPGAVAIVLQMFVFRNSPIYRLRERPRWFFYYYLAYIAIQFILAVGSLAITDARYATLASILIQLLLVGGLVLLGMLRLVSGKETFARAGLSGGKWWFYVLFGLLFVLFYAAMTGLNALFDLGQAVDVKDLLTQAAGGQAEGLDMVPGWTLLAIVGFQAVILGPLLGLLMAFGEEYGWRGYLQGELVKMGRMRGILLVGVIWGLWHIPLVLMGHNYPGHPLLGSVLMMVYSITLALILGYAVLKSGSVWLAAFLHALNNQVLAFLVLAVYTPNDPVYSFGIGLYSIVLLVIIAGALLVFDSKEWRTLVPAASQGDGTDRPLEAD
jgi:membrane protease YdiL (CAAX protease family)